MTLDEIKNVIELAVSDSTAYILDPMQDGQHLQALVISDNFIGQPLIKQHKAVMSALKEALASDVHAMGVKTFTKEKWEQSRSQFGL